MKGLPLAYNRDLQEDKELLFDSVDTLQACLEIYTMMLPKIKVNREVMRTATLTGFINATDFADYLVGKGLPFRTAHHCVGQAVGYALAHKKELHDLSLDELKSFSALIQEDVFEILSTEAMIDRRRSTGGTATKNVRAAIASARATLEP
jgi:argininosuccinate lyase